MRVKRRLAVSTGLLALAVATADAHDGPPYAILVDHPTGPANLSVWADPDVGIGTFYVYLEPLDADTPIPADAAVRISVWPRNERLPEASYTAESTDGGRRDQERFYCEVDFDRQEWWNVRLEVSGDGKSGSHELEVEVTPPGQGPVLDFVLYLFPFVAVGVLVVRGILSGRSKAGDRSPGGGAADPTEPEREA